MSLHVDDLEIVLDLYERIASGGNNEFLISTVIPGTPASKSRPRFGRGGHAYTSAESRAAEERTAAHFRAFVTMPFTGNVALGCVFFRPNRQRIDTDNLIKHVCDAANGILWLDDSQVTAVMGIAEFDPENPRTIVVVGQHVSSLARGSDAIYPCSICGADIVRTGQTKLRKTCSRKCAYAARGIVLLDEPVPCPTCGDPFKRISQYQQFCSRECAIESFRNKRRSHAAPRSKCPDCGIELKHTRGGRCRACWAKSVAASVA